MNQSDPAQLRKVYFDAWQKASKQEPLTGIEVMIVDIIQRHPEYHPLFSVEHFDDFLHEKFQLDHNPFFHLALHLTIVEQVGANRPIGMKDHFERLMKKHQDKTIVEHKMIDCLARILVENFKNPNESHEDKYLESIARLN